MGAGNSKSNKIKSNSSKMKHSEVERNLKSNNKQEYKREISYFDKESYKKHYNNKPESFSIRHKFYKSFNTENDNLDDSTISCPICFDTYNDNNNAPVVFHCGHTICNDCHKKNKENNNRCFYCNIIQKSEPIKNYAVLDIISKKNRSYKNKDGNQLFFNKKVKTKNNDSFDVVADVVSSDQHIDINSNYKFLSASWDSSIKYWNSNSKSSVKTYYGHEDFITSLIHIDKNMFASCSFDKTIKLWKVTNEATPTNTFIKSVRGHSDSILGIIKMSSNHIISLCKDNTMKIWTVPELKCLYSIINDNISVDKYKNLCFIKLEDNAIAVGSDDNKIRVYDFSSILDSKINDSVNNINNDNSNHNNNSTLALDNTNNNLNKNIEILNSISSNNYNNKELLNNQRNLKELSVSSSEFNIDNFYKYVLEGHNDNITCLLNLDSSHLVSGSYDYTLRIWNKSTTKCLKQLIGHKKYILSIVKLNNSILVSSSADKTIILWNINENCIIKTLTGHTNWINCLAKISDSIIISGSNDNTIRVWNVFNGKCIEILKEHTSHIYSLVVMKGKKH